MDKVGKKMRVHLVYHGIVFCLLVKNGDGKYEKGESPWRFAKCRGSFGCVIQEMVYFHDRLVVDEQQRSMYIYC